MHKVHVRSGETVPTCRPLSAFTDNLFKTKKQRKTNAQHISLMKLNTNYFCRLTYMYFHTWCMHIV